MSRQSQVSRSGRTRPACTDAIQFPDEPAAAYDEIRGVLKPGGRVALTCGELEGVRSLQWAGLLRHELAVATNPR